MSFGKWYNDQKAANNASLVRSESAPAALDIEAGGSMTLPLFGGVQSPIGSWNNFKQGLEAQMPQKIFGMGYQQRFQMFCTLQALSLLFFALAFFVGVPTLALKPRKFALSFTCGSLTFMTSFAILRGPYAHLKALFCDMDRLPFTLVYIGSMISTLYFTFRASGLLIGYVMVVGSSALQILALTWYLIAFLPGGAHGLKVLAGAIQKMMRPLIVGCTKLWANLISYCFGCLRS